MPALNPRGFFPFFPSFIAIMEPDERDLTDLHVNACDMQNPRLLGLRHYF